MIVGDPPLSNKLFRKQDQQDINIILLPNSCRLKLGSHWYE